MSPAPKPLHPIRKKLRELMLATLADSENWTYRAVRPLPIPLTWRKGQKVISDCSWGVKLLNRWAKAPDPMRTGYGPWGNSGTLTASLPHLDHPSQLLVGDPVTFGPHGDEHAAAVLEPGDDPLLWSDGHQGAPNTYRLSNDHREQHYLRLILPDWKPTKADLLRAKTGYWSWLQWALAEGAWRGYTKRDRNVRPNVPKIIPLSWWKRRARFVANRNKPQARDGSSPLRPG